MAALVPPAIALGRGEAIDVPESRYSETAMLGRSLLHASRMLSQARRQAYHDPLTSLSNRLLFANWRPARWPRASAAPGPPRCWRWTWITSRR